MNKILIILLGGLILTSCSLIFETDLNDSQVYLIAPADSLVTKSNVITLWWEYVENAEKYNLQIVSPNWDNIETLILDTNITSNKYNVSLDSGDYAWGVSAYNNSSSTAYTVRHLKVIVDSLLTYVIINNLSPEDGYATNDQYVYFSWEEVARANTYIFEIRNDPWESNVTVYQRSLQVNHDSCSLKEGKYVWGVQAKDDKSMTAFRKHSLIIDRTSPGKPTLTKPSKNGDTLYKPDDEITWERAVETPQSAITDSIFISKNSIFSSDSLVEFQAISGTSFSIDGLENGKYYVKIRSCDVAGNLGEYSIVRKFYVNEE